MKNNKLFYTILIVICFFICCFVWYKSSRISYKVIEIDKIYVEAGKSEYSLLHIGDIPKGDVKLLKKLMKDYGLVINVIKYPIETVKKHLDIEVTDKTAYIVFNNAEAIGTLDVGEKYEYYQEKLDKYVYHIIPDSELNLITSISAAEFADKVISNNYTIAVFGYDGCSYCTLYKPVLNEIVNDYGLDIYYFDSNKFDSTEYERIVDLQLEIPAKCTSNHEATNISEKFASPMTLILKKGKTVDCIKGNVTKGTVESVLKQYKIIKEK